MSEHGNSLELSNRVEFLEHRLHALRIKCVLLGMVGLLAIGLAGACCVACLHSLRLSKVESLSCNTLTAKTIYGRTIFLRGNGNLYDLMLSHNKNDGKPYIRILDSNGKNRLFLGLVDDYATCVVLDEKDVPRAALNVRIDGSKSYSGLYIRDTNNVNILDVTNNESDEPAIYFSDSTEAKAVSIEMKNGWPKISLKNPHGNQSLSVDAGPLEAAPTMSITDEQNRKRVYLLDREPKRE